MRIEGNNNVASPSKTSKRGSEAASPQEEYVCWSRMQAEAGQSLEDIVARKELEREAGNGSFFWGVGNSPAVVANVLARAKVPVRVVFSIMKSRPKAIDSSPARTLVWRRYIDADSVDRPLPEHVLVTSRGDSAKGRKRTHYALMCRSNSPLVLRYGQAFDPNAYRNAGGNRAPVGASQVTALLRRTSEGVNASDYEENLVAWLDGSYWVKLLDPLELSTSKKELLADIASGSTKDWCKAVAKLRSGPASESHSVPEGVLF